MTELKYYGNCQGSTSSTAPSAGAGSSSNACVGGGLDGGSGFSTAGLTARAASRAGERGRNKEGQP